MNILVISLNIYPCVTGGVEVFNYHFIKAMAKKVNNILVFSTCDHLINEKNVSYVKFKQRRFPGFYLLNDVLIFLNIVKLRNNIDIVHIPYTSNSHLAYPILFAKKFLSVPYVIVIHGGGMHRWKPKIVHQLFFKEACEIVAVSKTIKTEYEKRSNRTIKEIPPLIPFSESNCSKKELRDIYGFNQDDLIILSLGSIKKIKGNKILLDSFLSLGVEFIEANNLKLFFVGDGELRLELVDKVKNKKMEKYVKFAGKVSYETVPQMYKLADIYIIPSFFEGTSISMLEAMFNGMPIIGSDVNGINKLIINEKNGLLFEMGNVDELKKKIKLITTNRSLANSLGQAAKEQYFNHYSFEHVVSEHVNLMESILK